jgi:predicted membrane protein
MAVFVVSTFVIPILVHLLTAINNVPKGDSRLSKPRSTIVTKFVVSTVLIGLAACLFTFQILHVLFIGYCLKGMVYTSHLVFLAIIAAVAGILVAVGMVAWITSTIVFFISSLSWCRHIMHRAIKGAGDSASAHVRNTSSLRESRIRDEQVSTQEHVKRPAPTLTPHMV